jgi:cytochrome P450 family 150 subfamily A5
MPLACDHRASFANHMNSSDFDSIDFLKPGPYYQDPHPYFDHLRQRSPVWREPHHGVVMVTGYDECAEVYRDSVTYSNAALMAGPFARWPEPLEGEDVSEIIERYRDQLPLSDQLVTFDPPKHTAHRALLARLITPKRLKENEDFLWHIADRQIGEFVQRGKCEFIADYANPFTLLGIADLLGVPEQHHKEFLGALQKKEAEHEEKDRSKVDHKPLEYLYRRFTDFIEDRRRTPQNDVLTSLATATFPDGSLPEVRDVMVLASGLFAAGQETTARLLGVMFQYIGERPEVQASLRADKSRIPRFVEECLRLGTPIQADFRLARRATTLGGVDVPPGTSVMVIPAAANRDPRRFENPHELWIDRPNSRQHVAFASGIHSCAGAPLARTEARISAERLLDRMADIRISEAKHGPAGARRYEYPKTFILRGHNHLHLEFTPVEEA